ncbi:MAG: hypothetical protein IJ328_05765 [Muribaculaceae bacterium]|nr:hypothetical protein [Muribaculaceae bacterium]
MRANGFQLIASSLNIPHKHFILSGLWDYSKNNHYKLREAADRENLSLNNYVESVLMDAVFSNPNKLTLVAMKETRENRDLETLDVNNLKSVIVSYRSVRRAIVYGI